MSEIQLTFRSVAEMVNEQCQRTPDVLALADGYECLEYRDLDARSNQLARHLQAIGVVPNSVVALWLPRSIAFGVSALGVLKAGGAYLPLDPASPIQRATGMLNDAKPVALVTRRSMFDSVPGGTWKIVVVEDIWDGTSAEGSQPVTCAAGPKDLAYVIYTSGSTGRPKGVQIEHRNLLNLIAWHVNAFDVRQADRASQVASPAFDAAVWEMWPYLCTGASVHIADEDIPHSPELLRDWLVSHDISIGFAPTPLAERMLRLEWPKATKLRTLLTGADTLRHYAPPDLPFQLINNYGPTECTVVATSGRVTADPNNGRPPSIGKPISNVQIYIFNDLLEALPSGAVGEIYIGGAGVARGYLGAPELTAQRFVRNPLTSDPDDRLYKTGDAGCYLPDGQIAFRGRIDEQVKIRGHRIEPNEIAGVLAKARGVQECVVVGHASASAETQLVAYIVPQAEQRPSGRDLRALLKLHVPEYMIPAVFVQTDSLPINANGKIDRANLPPVGTLRSLDDDSYIAPRTPVEQRIAEIVKALLAVNKVSVEENFFMMGGHSLLGTQLIARIADVFNVRLSLRKLFESPTVAGLSAEVEKVLFSRLEAMTEDEAGQLLRGISG